METNPLMVGMQNGTAALEDNLAVVLQNYMYSYHRI